MKTVGQALIDEVLYPIPRGFVENRCFARGLYPEEEVSTDIINSDAYKGALADCLYSLIQAINFSEADKSVGNLTDEQRKAILKRVNKLYNDIGEEEVAYGTKPAVYIMS